MRDHIRGLFSRRLKCSSASAVDNGQKSCIPQQVHVGLAHSRTCPDGHIGALASELNCANARASGERENCTTKAACAEEPSTRCRQGNDSVALHVP